VRTRLFLATALAALVVFPALPYAQSDLEALMKQVLTRRDDNWKKLQQYTLDQEDRFQISALNGRKIFGFEREYTWFPNDGGIFVRSPVRADGVDVSEADRRQAETQWIKREDARNKGRAKRAEQRAAKAAEGNGPDRPPSIEDIVKAGGAPDFVSSAYFLEFKFDEGSYAFAGKDQLLGREVYKVEYYPKKFFNDDDERNRRKKAEAKPGEKPKKQDIGDRIDEKMDKVSMITLWIEPTEKQILQYEFTNIDFDFMPGRSMVRLDDLRANMRMREAFPNVWLPDTIGMRFGMSTALGDVQARYDVRYHNYKLAEVKARVR
jgi:hypothetical protein